ncbi:MAG: hypothetical protein E7267_06745 [Lachnospiraceae bacterium]|nr:hypothetical protein [Lachnospiraceae bacterium]
MRKKYLSVLLILSTLFSLLTGCNNKSIEAIYGQELVKCGAIYDTDSKLSYELPIICEGEIKDFSVEEYYVDGEGQYEISFEKLEGGYKYKGLYYYLAYFNVGVEKENPAKITIESVDMKINGKLFTYDMEDMHFSNIKGTYGDEFIPTQGALLYGNGGPAVVINKIPEEKYVVEFLVEEDCVIREIAYHDYLDISDIEVSVNGVETKYNNNIVLKKGDNVMFKYYLKYKEGVFKYDIVKTTLLVKYSIADNKYIFSDEQGLVIINLRDSSFIKDYIDEKLGGK